MQKGREVQRQAILVLGAHRSGTSAVAGAVRLLGGAPPAHVLPPASDNPTGFWESPAVIATNDWILASAGTSWFECLSFDVDPLDLKTRTAAWKFIMLSLTIEFDQARLLLIKDPRICLLLDLWLPALHARRILPAALLVLRHPGAVAASLARRSGLPQPQGVALWLGYMLEAERATRSCRRCILPYDELLGDWHGGLLRAGREIDVTWPVAVDAVVAEMEGFLNPDLRHHHHSGSSVIGLRMGRAPLGLWSEEVYAALASLARNRTEVRSLARLADVYTAFSAWCRTEGQALATSLPANHFVRKIPSYKVPAAWHRIV
jgi:hypothetical protein